MKKVLLTLVVLLCLASVSEAGVFFTPFRAPRVVQNNIIINKTFVPAQQVVGFQRSFINVNRSFVPFNSFSAVNYGVSRSFVPVSNYSYGQFQAPLLLQAAPVYLQPTNIQFVPQQVQYNLGVPQTQTTITTTTTTTNLLGR